VTHSIPIIEGHLLPGNWKIALVVSRFNDLLTEHMAAAAINTFHRLGGRDDNLTIVRVPGSFEFPVTAKKLAETGQYRAVICLGCVIRGETDHYDHVVEQTAQGIREVNTQTGVPCIFGVITADTLEQCVHRAGAKSGNKGAEAALAAIEMTNLLDAIDAIDARPSPTSK
jgi:6,7-dimethyl-8-ribityllumazine synthase